MSVTLASMNAAGLGRAATLRVSPAARLRAVSRPARLSSGRVAPGGSRVAPVTRAAVDATVAYAVAQQNLVFAALVAAECVYQQGNLPADYEGRPELPKIALPCGLFAGAFALIQTDQTVLSPGGLALGAVACFFSGKYFLDRYDAIVPDGMDWPGPRVFPGTGIIFSLFVFLANVAEAMHASGDLARRADPSDRLSRPKTYFDAKTVENHVRLAAHAAPRSPRHAPRPSPCTAR